MIDSNIAGGYFLTQTIILFLCHTSIVLFVYTAALYFILYIAKKWKPKQTNTLMINRFVSGIILKITGKLPKIKEEYKGLLQPIQ